MMLLCSALAAGLAAAAAPAAAEAPAAPPVTPMPPAAAPAPPGAVATAPQAPAGAAARQLSLEAALALVDTDHAAVRAARARAEAAGAGADAVRGHLLPALHIGDSETLYHTKVGISGSPFGPLDPRAFSGFPTELAANVASAAVGQPLLGLVHRAYDHAAARRRADAGGDAVRAARADARANVKIGFLRLFEARALAETAEESARDLDEQVEVAQKKLDAGASTTADVLRVKVAAAGARQQIIAARAQEATTEALLRETLGLADSPTPLHFVAPDDLAAGSPAPLSQVREAAVRRRPEVSMAQHQAAAARHVARARAWALLPELDVEGSYMHIRASPYHGKTAGTLTADTASVGLKASWNVWEWGASWYAHEEAAASAAAAAADAEQLQRQVGAEAAARRAEAQASASTVELSQTQVSSAEEAYRVTQALSQAGSATTTDLLDAQAALTSARLTLVRAQYSNAVATVALQRAVGDDG